MDLFDFLFRGTTESWLTLLLALSVGLWPVWVWAGMVWGRMQADDEHARRTREARGARARLDIMGGPR